MLKLENKNLKRVLNLPTDYSEISFDYIQKKVEDIVVSERRLVVAIIAKTNLTNIANMAKGSDELVGKCIIVPVILGSKVDPIWQTNKRVVVDLRTTPITRLQINNELSVERIKSFIESDLTLKLSVTKGDVFKNVSTNSVVEVNKQLMNATKSDATLITEQIKTVICTSYAIIGEHDIQAMFKDDALTSKDTFDSFESTMSALELN